MSRKTALILAAAAGLLAAVLALLPVPGHAAEYVYRHRLLGIQTAALVANDAVVPAQDAVGLSGVRFISNWSAADWSAFDALDGVSGDLTLYANPSPGAVQLEIWAGAPGSNPPGALVMTMSDFNKDGPVNSPLVGTVTWSDGKNWQPVAAPAGLPPLSLAMEWDSSVPFTPGYQVPLSLTDAN